MGILIYPLLPGTRRAFGIQYGAIVWALLGGGLILVGTVLQWLRERRQDQPRLL